jgi:hypothetical protein
MSVDPKTKSDRERYIRVAAIDIVTSEGNWNICVAEEHKSLSHEITNKNVRGSTDLMFKNRVQFSILYRYTGKKVTIPFRFKMMNTCDNHMGMSDGNV